jgi:hypothetical protein
MTERTITESQLEQLLKDSKQETYWRHEVMETAFPKLAKAGELINVNNGSIEVENWEKFICFGDHGRVITGNRFGEQMEWENYRRQTPAERGESND